MNSNNKWVSESLSVFHCNEALFLVMCNSGTYLRARNFNGLSQARFLLLYPPKKQQAVTRSKPWREWSYEWLSQIGKEKRMSDSLVHNLCLQDRLKNSHRNYWITSQLCLVTFLDPNKKRFLGVSLWSVARTTCRFKRAAKISPLVFLAAL